MKDENRLWRTIAYLFFAGNTSFIIILLEMIILGRPYFSLFLLILAVSVYLNFKFFLGKKTPRKDKKPAKAVL